MADIDKLTFAALVTTGPEPAEDSVLEVGAVRVQDGQEAGAFSRLADPGGVPLVVQKLTGLDEKALSGKARPAEVLEEFAAFLEQTPVVVHEVETMAGFLAEAGLALAPDALDGRLLARIVRPEADDYSLETLAEELNLEAAEVHRALGRARLSARIWAALTEELERLPGAVLDTICRVAQAAEIPLARPLAETANRRAGFELSDDPWKTFTEVLQDHSRIFARAQSYERPEPGEEPLDTEKIRGMFTPRGAVGRHLPGYEQRDEQVEMLCEVCEAFNEKRHLIFEASTGTGKSMAYLLPAIAWARQNEDKVIVSTNTKNLQEQLYHKDLPFLREILNGRFEAALLKGRRNYLCVRRLLHLLRHFEWELSEPAEMRALLPLIVWAARTQTGDLAECRGLLTEESGFKLIPRVTASGDECTGRACRAQKHCFVRRARALAQLADVVVVNHALLFAEVGLDQPYLPLDRCLIFDEAHNVEDVATEALAVTADALSVFRVTNRLWRRRQDGSGSGIIATVMYEAERNLPQSKTEDLILLAQGAISRIDDVVEATHKCFDTLAEPFKSVPIYEEKILLRECHPPVGLEGATGEAANALTGAIHRLAGRLEALAVSLEDNQEERENTRELANDLRAQNSRLKEAADALQFVLSREKEGYVYWLERTRRGEQTFYALKAAPLQIGTLMRSYFFDPLRCVIMTSATVRVNGRFEYVRERLGADGLSEERLRCAAVGSPFDFDRQTMVCVPTFLPDAGGRRDEAYDEELAAFLVSLLKATEGRALVLSTSYSLLNSLYNAIKPPLERAGMPVFAQGRDGSREAITALFRSITNSVLLGTQSFWEGVDISGEALSCLVLTKLPFHVFTDPLVRGRIELLRSQGLDPFRHYTLPEAVISFRQGFGRLIRNRTDRGVIAVTDRRLVTRHYGRAFLRDMPTRHRVFHERQALLRAVRQFFQQPY